MLIWFFVNSAKRTIFRKNTSLIYGTLIMIIGPIKQIINLSEELNNYDGKYEIVA
jgi:hypothetical protein